TATTVLARDVFRGSPWDLGIAGGFATVAATELISAADVVLVVGAGLNPFTSRFGAVFGPEAHVIRVDIEPGPTQVPVGQTLVGDARDLAEALLAALGPTPSGLGNAWRSTALAGDGREARLRDPGAELAEDGRLDPRSLVTELDRRLPATRSLVQDIGHSIGWAPMYLSLPAGAPTVFMGTAFQSIGLGVLGAIGVAQAGAAAGTVVLGTGDGSALMALADLDTLARTAPSCVVVVYNDGAYGAEVHQYATQGLDPGPMLLKEADFAQLARGVGGSGAVIRRHADLAALDEWVAAGASGLFVLDCRVSATLVAPFMEEIAAHVRAHDEKRSSPERGQNSARLG
ncbi:thiamine pyrophosphate-dependent enzyme, partial [Leucobacter sp. M11]|uniref:thiamine pyrophosphate-dependent enzyme n=1 Tax=Leucobacter sp. M11 TaxID=2993565 RepID=UPI002D7ECD49